MKIKQFEWHKNIDDEWIPSIPSVHPSFLPNYKIVPLLSDSFTLYFDNKRLLDNYVIGFEKSKLLIKSHFENYFRRCIENE